MKRIILAAALLASGLGVQAQTRKYVANFSLFQQYFNPALTGYEGSMVKTFYRDQWTGFEAAPNAMFASGELDLADLAEWKKRDLLKTQEEDIYNRQLGSRHAFGLVVLNDRFGPFKESQVQLSYSSRIRLSKALALRMGAAVTYSSQLVDGTSLTLDQENDPEFQGVLGRRSSVNKMDLNLGLMLTAEKYYVGYALQDVTEGNMLTTGDAYLERMFQRQHVVQAGYRRAINEEFGVIANGMYWYSSTVKETIEGQLKGVFRNTFWLGGGYRQGLAYNLTTGVRLSQLKIGYVYETPVGEASAMTKSTNEIALTYNLIPVLYPKFSNRITMW
jgi:type IX secretion system PorP/SprF family membrane protein